MRFIKNFWFVPLALLTTVASLLYLSDAWSPLEQYHIVFCYSRDCAMLLAFPIIPCCFFVTVLQLRHLGHSHITKQKTLLLILSAFPMISSNAIVCVSFPALLNRYVNLNSEYLGDHLYRLDSMLSGTWSNLGTIILLWECDKTSLFCRIVYSRDYTNDMKDLKLTSDLKSNSVSLVVNDKIVYQYFPTTAPTGPKMLLTATSPLNTDMYPGIVALTKARRLWTARLFLDYRMIVEYPGLFHNAGCVQDIEVDKDMIKVFVNTCNWLPLTVDDLFNRIEHDMVDPLWVNGSGCDIMAVYPTYNAQLGYPEAIQYRQEYPNPSNAIPSVYQAYQDHWKSGALCTLLGMVEGGIKITSLTPPIF